jgi:hypothetical protein
MAAKGFVDINRVMVLRTASNYCMPPPGQGVTSTIGDESMGTDAALESAYRTGSAVVARAPAGLAQVRGTRSPATEAQGIGGLGLRKGPIRAIRSGVRREHDRDRTQQNHTHALRTPRLDRHAKSTPVHPRRPAGFPSMGNFGGNVATLSTPEPPCGPLIGSVEGFAAAKAAGTRIVMVTAYDAWSARLLAETPVDCLLVGDSAMMVVHGEKDTLGATPEIMAMHTRAVAAGRTRASSSSRTCPSWRRAGARPTRSTARRCSCGPAPTPSRSRARTGHTHVIRHLVESGIPVMGHLGLTPQWVRGAGRFQGAGEGR